MHRLENEHDALFREYAEIVQKELVDARGRRRACVFPCACAPDCAVQCVAQVAWEASRLPAEAEVRLCPWSTSAAFCQACA